jgi:hypothetical protein
MRSSITLKINGAANHQEILTEAEKKINEYFGNEEIAKADVELNVTEDETSAKGKYNATVFIRVR